MKTNCQQNYAVLYCSYDYTIQDMSAKKSVSNKAIVRRECRCVLRLAFNGISNKFNPISGYKLNCFMSALYKLCKTMGTVYITIDCQLSGGHNR